MPDSGDNKILIPAPKSCRILLLPFFTEGPWCTRNIMGRAGGAAAILPDRIEAARPGGVARALT